jgi:predicted transposase/invertase (TIGR01784 family)
MLDKRMDKNLVNSHDRFFKELFSKKEEVSEFIAKTFPKEIVEKIDLQSLELDKTEYVDSKLRTNYSDIVYNSKYGKHTNIKISLLFEHKSYPETFPHLQLLGYMLKIWETQIKQKQSITPIIPIIFYHGKQKWVKQTFDTYFDEIDETLHNFIPKFEYQLVDTFEYSDDEIIKLFSNLQLQMGLLILKNIYNEQKIIQEVDKIFGEINQLLQTEQGEQFFEAIVSYLYYATNLETPKMVEKMRTISPNAGEKFVSTAMRLEMKGIEKGIKKVAYSLLKQGVSDEIILIATKLTQKELDYLKSIKEYQLELETV